MNIEIINTIKMWAEFIGAIALAITGTILLIKITFKKVDKNNNGKIEKEEITDADIEFCKELLKDSVSVIATGIMKNSGMNSKQAYNFTINEIKKAKNIFEETEGENKNESKKN